MSTNSIVVGTTRSGLTIAASWSCRGSGIGTTPALGSIVQKGKFCASIPAFVNALKSVDLPTLGNPTMPHLKPMLSPLALMQGVHGLIPSALNNVVNKTEGVIHRLINLSALFRGRFS